MSYRDFDAIQKITDTRFPDASFGISCFESGADVYKQCITYCHSIIIIQYEYRPQYYKHCDVVLNDVDYIVIQNSGGIPYIRTCDVIDALIDLEKAGTLKKNPGMYLESFHKITDQCSIPKYRIMWGN